MYLLFRQPIHHHPERLVRAQGNEAEPFRLPVRPILEELHVLEVVDSDVGYGVCYILIRCPLEKVEPTTQLQLRLK